MESNLVLIVIYAPMLEKNITLPACNEVILKRLLGCSFLNFKLMLDTDKVGPSLLF